MRQLCRSLVLLLALLPVLRAAEQSSTTKIPEITLAAESYRKAAAAIHDTRVQRSAKATKDYTIALDQLRKEITATGDLEASLAVKHEQERVAKRDDPNEDQRKKMTGKLLVLRAAYDREIQPFREAAKKEKDAAAAKFLTDIDAVQQRLFKAGRVDRANLIKALHEQIVAKGEVPDHPDEPNVPSAPVGPEKLDPALAAKIKAAIAAKKINQTHGTGKGTEGWPELPEDGALLIGFELSEFTWEGAAAIKTLRPIFMSEKGVFTGKMRGKDPGKITTIRAKPGFAVSGFHVYHGERLLGFQLAFSKVDPATGKFITGPQMVYTSKWYGSKGKNTDPKVCGEGSLIIGVWGTSGAEADSLGPYELP